MVRDYGVLGRRDVVELGNEINNIPFGILIFSEISVLDV